MASHEVDQKFLGRLAKSVETSNPLLSSMLFKILGLSINLAGQLVRARKQRKLDPTRATASLELYFHIIWLSREGLVMLEQYVLPMVGDYHELKVLAYKLRASFYHIFVLFHNNPPVTTLGLWTPEAITAAISTSAHIHDKHSLIHSMVADIKGKSVDRGGDRSSLQPTHPMEGGAVGPPPGFSSSNNPNNNNTAGMPSQPPDNAASFLMPAADYLPTAHKAFAESAALADALLWGSHSLRLSAKTEHAAFLYECAHDRDASRRVAADAIRDANNATEGIDDDMYEDAVELVTILSRMARRACRLLRQLTVTPRHQQHQGGAGGGGDVSHDNSGSDDQNNNGIVHDNNGSIRNSPTNTADGARSRTSQPESVATAIPPVGMENPI